MGQQTSWLDGLDDNDSQDPDQVKQSNKETKQEDVEKESDAVTSVDQADINNGDSLKNKVGEARWSTADTLVDVDDENDDQDDVDVQDDDEENTDDTDVDEKHPDDDDSVFQVAQYLGLVNDTMMQYIPTDEIFVEGEVSDYRVSQNKWVHFDLKDEEEEAILKCFMTVWQLDTTVEDGMRVRVKGYPKIYERFGSFSLNVKKVKPVGEGALRKAYEKLKKKLKKEGLFDEGRKRSIPRFPKRVGLLTSRDAAAYGDFMRILNNRWGGVDVLFRHVHVQGKNAVSDILEAFEMFNDMPEDERPDVLVLTRGGGGLEDLHAFNDEQVAKAVFGSDIPVVCGVGHERDESLSDFVADVRASTPSNAAEVIVPRREEVKYEIQTMMRRMEDRLKESVAGRQRAIRQATRSMEFVLERQRTRYGILYQKLMDGVESWLRYYRERLDSDERLLKQIDPKRVLSRGYGIIRSEEGVVTGADTVAVGDDITIELSKDKIGAEVTSVDET
jgi:exodeoxyribonuclease VII large subunit